MDLRRVRREESPRDRGCLRLTGEVVFDTPGLAAQELWFEVPGEHAGDVSKLGDAWLACLLALAARRGETLRLCEPVDGQLLRSAHELLRIWACWYPPMRQVAIEAAARSAASESDGRRTASVFSGGVDSFFTAIDGGEPDRVDDLITIPGFGIRRDDEAVASVRDSLSAAADALGKTLVVVRTNVTAGAGLGYPWELSHSGVLAAAGLLLERRYARVLIPSTHGYGYLAPGGSHPLTDPLFSTAQTQIIHHGSAYSRAAKLERIAGERVVQRSLQVCVMRSDRNCGVCRKCYCTMLHLDVLGLLPAYRDAFPIAAYDAGAVATIDSEGWDVRSYLECVRERAEQRGRADVAAAIRRGFRRTDNRSRWRRLRRFASATARSLFGAD